MKFTNIKLASGISGARAGQGLTRDFTYYIADSKYSIGTDATTTNEDYYIVWNNWPSFTGATRTSSKAVAGAFAGIGITNLFTQIGTSHVADTSLDCVIIRKSDRKAVQLTITGTTRSHYEDINASNSSTTFTAITPNDGPWTPEVGRLVNMGYIG